MGQIWSIATVIIAVVRTMLILRIISFYCNMRKPWIHYPCPCPLSTPYLRLYYIRRYIHIRKMLSFRPWVYIRPPRNMQTNEPTVSVRPHIILRTPSIVFRLISPRNFVPYVFPKGRHSSMCLRCGTL